MKELLQLKVVLWYCKYQPVRTVSNITLSSEDSVVGGHRGLIMVGSGV